MKTIRTLQNDYKTQIIADDCNDSIDAIIEEQEMLGEEYFIIYEDGQLIYKSEKQEKLEDVQEKYDITRELAYDCIESDADDSEIEEYLERSDEFANCNENVIESLREEKEQEALEDEYSDKVSGS